MKLAVVLVHYHTPDLLSGAWAALVREAEASGLELEAVLVDNGSRPQDREILASLPVRRLDPGRNLGYAGGVNLGLRETTAEQIVVMNPDVEILPGCLARLVEALDAGASAAGPRFYWDHGKRFLLPPTEAVSRSAALAGILARKGGLWARLARRQWRRHARRQWLACEPFSSYDLSGALLALRRSAWLRVGPFDDGYKLYFEETDWLLRLRAARLDARFVPSAEAVHLYAQSTHAEGRARDWFEASSRRFRRRVHGEAFNELLERLSRRLPTAAGPEPAPSSPVHPAAWLEVSPSPLGFPAAGRRFSPPAVPPADLPAEIRERLAAGSYTLRCVSEKGRELESWLVEKSGKVAFSSAAGASHDESDSR